MGQTIYYNGDWRDRDGALLSPDDRGFLFSDGVYEVVRSYGGRPFELDAHLRRLADSLSALRIEGVEAGELATVITPLIERNDLGEADALIYVQVTRGCARRTHRFPDPPVPPTVYATATPFEPEGDPAAGVAAITTSDLRWARCDIKSVSLVANCLASQLAWESLAAEAVLVRDGVALEGTHSNFFGVFGDEVRTAPRSNYILAGITRRVVLELCREDGIKLREAPIYVHELEDADELFLTGTTTEVTPVVNLDGRDVGGGSPGPVALRLLELLRART